MWRPIMVSPNVVALAEVVTTLPPASETHRGKMYTLRATGSQDITAICLKNSDGSYDWHTYAEGTS
jgi:hypothetical protein